MRVEYDRVACQAWFQCVQEWDAFDMNVVEGKADLRDADEVEEGVYVRDVPPDAEEAVERAASVCPVDAITVYDDDGDQLVP